MANPRSECRAYAVECAKQDITTLSLEVLNNRSLGPVIRGVLDGRLRFHSSSRNLQDAPCSDAGPWIPGKSAHQRVGASTPLQGSDFADQQLAFPSSHDWNIRTSHNGYCQSRRPTRCSSHRW